MNLLITSGLKRTCIQLASHGRWEDALLVDELKSTSIETWLMEADQDVAVEAVFHDASNTLRGFVGFRRHIKNANDRRIFWCKILEASELLKTASPKDNLCAWLNIVGQASLLEKPPEGAELGVFNKWQSSKPIVLNNGRLRNNDLKDGPDWVRHGSISPICRELLWRDPENFWVADVVSHLVFGKYVLDADMVPN